MVSPFVTARRVAGLAGLLSAALFAACSDSSTAPGPVRPAPGASSRVLINTALPGVVVPGADGGAFTNAATPTEATRLAGAFWDNVSSDDQPWPNPTSKCNIGFYAVGSMGPICLLQSPGSLANQGGMTNYWGDNGGIGGGRDASSFMFGGSYSYAVTLIGSYAGNSSEVGWFTKSGGVYTFHPITDWGNKTINHSETINTGGLDWGFYVKNTALDATGNCAPQTSCSDATGGYSSAPFNQFAMFINSGGTQLLVGLEDNRLSPLWNGPDPTNNPTNRDSDYNDYIFRIVPSSLVHCGRTLGFWKNKGLADGWPSPYTPGQTIGSVFNAAAAGTAASVTLLDALEFKGGSTLQDKKNLLLKQAVAALLNSAVPTFNYPLSTSALISAVNAALLSGNATTILNLQSQLDAFNNLEGCLNP